MESPADSTSFAGTLAAVSPERGGSAAVWPMRQQLEVSLELLEHSYVAFVSVRAVVPRTNRGATQPAMAPIFTRRYGWR